MEKLGKQYFETLNPTLKQYFEILSKEIPDFLYEYIATPEMQKQGGISATCGTCYTNLFDMDLHYSSLDHSVAVALKYGILQKTKNKQFQGYYMI